MKWPEPLGIVHRGHYVSWRDLFYCISHLEVIFINCMHAYLINYNEFNWLVVLIFGRSILVHQSNGMKKQMQSHLFQITRHPNSAKGLITSHWTLCNHYARLHMGWWMYFQLKIVKVLFVRLFIYFLVYSMLQLYYTHGHSCIHIYVYPFECVTCGFHLCF